MSKLQSNRFGIFDKRAARILASALFLFTAITTVQAQSNIATGSAYGTNDWSSAPSIISQTNGSGSLTIRSAATTNLTLGHTINGSIVITNRFDDFSIVATSAVMFSASSSVLHIADGTNLTLNGGTFRSTAAGLHAVYATNTSIVIEDGTFTGGDTTAPGGAAIYTYNSNLRIEDGTFTGGKVNGGTGIGLLSQVSSNETRAVQLNGGTFSALGFKGGGMQNITLGTNLTVTADFIQSGGTLLIDNLTDDPLQQVTIHSGIMTLNNDFVLGSGGTFNLLSPDSRAEFSNLQVEDGGSLFVGRGELDVSGDLQLDSNGILWLQVESTNSYGTVTANSATFSSNSIVRLSGSITAEGTNELTLISTTTSLTLSDVQFETNLLGRSEVIAMNQTGSALSFEIGTESLKNYWGAEGNLGLLADELLGLITPAMNESIDRLNDPDVSARLIEQTYFSTMNTFQSSVNGLEAAAGQSVARSADLRAQYALRPKGAAGPERNSDLRGWSKVFAQLHAHDPDGLVPGYDTDTYGITIGVDRNFGNLLLGLSGGSGKYTTTYGSGSEDARQVQGTLYSSIEMERLYVDAGLSYGHNKVDTRTADPFVLNGTFDAKLMSAYLGAGYSLTDTEGGTAFTPECSIRYTTYEQDAYTETGTAAVPRNIDAFDADSLRTSIGLNISATETTILESYGFRLDGRFHWMHELNPDPGNTGFSLVNGSSSYELAYPLMDEDQFRLGFGVTFFNKPDDSAQNVLFRFDFDELVGNGFNSHNLSGKVVYAF